MGNNNEIIRADFSRSRRLEEKRILSLSDIELFLGRTYGGIVIIFVVVTRDCVN
jgi:hypothetical protein